VGYQRGANAEPTLSQRGVLTGFPRGTEGVLRSAAEYCGVWWSTAGYWRGTSNYCGVPAGYWRGTGGVPRGYGVLQGGLGIGEGYPRVYSRGIRGYQGGRKGYSTGLYVYSRVLQGALGEVSRDASGTRKALAGCSVACSKGYSAAYSGVLGGYSVDARGVLMGLLRLCGTLDYSGVYAHARG
jgi:hypothetical protein